MEELINKLPNINQLENDSMLMFIGSIAIVVLLVIVLVIVVSAMRVRVYKNRFRNLLVENQEKSEHIIKVEKELQQYKVKDTKNKQALSQFDETKKRLEMANETYLTLQNSFHDNAKELAKVTANLKLTEGMLEALKQEYETAKERFDIATEENNKYRTTNARLLTKLENEERYTQTVKQKQDVKK